MFWKTQYENNFYGKNGAASSSYSKFKHRPVEPTVTDYGKSLEIDAYMTRLQSYKKTHPDNIIFRNKNLARDLKREVNKLEGKQLPESATMSSFKPL